jgi:hypothetical protein
MLKTSRKGRVRPRAGVHSEGQLKRSRALHAINKLRWTTRNLAKTYLAYPLTLSEIGTGSRPIFQRLFLSSLTRLSARAGWNLKGPLSSHTFNRCQLTVPSKSAAPHTSSQFIETTFEKAKLNVRINGKKFEDLKDEDDGTLSQRSWLALGLTLSLLNLDREVEPFDEALDRETWSLYNQRLQWDLELATKRRNRPREVADLLENLFKVQDAALAELDKSVGEDEDRSDTSLPDGQLVLLFAS